jgi:ABC-type nitrate/sulfonate/bicarbonate transport system permease component
VIASRYIRRLFFPLLFLAAWTVGAGMTDPLLIPTPAATWAALAELARSGELWAELAVSLRRVAGGVVFGAAVGVPFGALVGFSRAAEALAGSVLPAVSATSSAIWAVLGVLWFGLGDGATVFVVAMTVGPILAVNTRDAVRAADPDLIQMARSMGFGPLAITWDVIVPAILPSLFAGLRLGIGFGWRVGLVAEALGSPSGVGFRLKQAVDLLHTPEMFAWSFSVILLIVVFEATALDLIEARSFRWRKPVLAA